MQKNECPLCDIQFNQIKTVNEKGEEIILEVAEKTMGIVNKHYDKYRDETVGENLFCIICE